MPAYTIAAYNVEWMNSLFEGGILRAEADVQARAAALASVVQRIAPDVLAISEAANERAEHEHFIAQHLNDAYTVVMGRSRVRRYR